MNRICPKNFRFHFSIQTRWEEEFRQQIVLFKFFWFRVELFIIHKHTDCVYQLCFFASYCFSQSTETSTKRKYQPTRKTALNNGKNVAFSFLKKTFFWFIEEKNWKVQQEFNNLIIFLYHGWMNGCFQGFSSNFFALFFSRFIFFLEKNESPSRLNITDFLFNFFLLGMRKARCKMKMEIPIIFLWGPWLK